MAKRKTKKKAEDQVEEEETLDDLEDLDELDDVEEEEPDADEDEDLEEDDDSDDDEEDEDEDEEDDEEDEEETVESLVELPIKVLRDRAKAAGLSAAKAKQQKGDKGKKSLAKYILKHEEADAEEDEPEEKPAKKSKGKKKGKSRKGQAPPTRELPKGRLGAQDIADAAGTDARTVRVWLRKHSDEWPKDEELGRYSFTKKDVTKIAKQIKKSKDD